MDSKTLVRKVIKFNLPRKPLDEYVAGAVRELYGSRDAALHIDVLRACNGERLGNSIVPGWRLLSDTELVALSAALNESLNLIDDEMKVIDRVVPIFSTSSKCDICYVRGGSLDAQVVHLDVGTHQQVSLLAPDVKSFWEAVGRVSEIDEFAFSGDRNAVGFTDVASKAWMAAIPAAYHHFAQSDLRGSGSRGSGSSLET